MACRPPDLAASMFQLQPGTAYLTLPSSTTSTHPGPPCPTGHPPATLTSDSLHLPSLQLAPLQPGLGPLGLTSEATSLPASLAAYAPSALSAQLLPPPLYQSQPVPVTGHDPPDLLAPAATAMPLPYLSQPQPGGLPAWAALPSLATGEAAGHMAAPHLVSGDALSAAHVPYAGGSLGWDAEHGRTWHDDSGSEDSDPAALVEDALLGELFFHNDSSNLQVCCSSCATLEINTTLLDKPSAACACVSFDSVSICSHLPHKSLYLLSWLPQQPPTDGSHSKC